MRSTLAVVCALAAATAVACPSTLAAAKAPKPITKTYYFHGTNAVGDVDQYQGFPSTTLMTMNATKPSGTGAKEFVFYGALITPNGECGGNALFPNWVGPASGTIIGTAKVSFWARSTPNATARVQVFPDVTEQACNSDLGSAYVDPIGQVEVPLPASATPVLVTVRIPIVKKARVAGALTVQIQDGVGPVGNVGAQVTGVQYDATSALSSITFTCLPKPGKKTC